MKPNDLILRCYAEQEKDGSWFSICIDLNLAVQGDSVKEVKEKMHTVIHDYIDEALTEDVEYIGDLLPRRAPMSFILKYYVISVVHSFYHAANCVKACKFKEFMPLKLA